MKVQYRNNENEKVYFATGILNEKVRYQIRNAYFKSSIGEKQGQAAVFEGFMDLLPALT